MAAVRRSRLTIDERREQLVRLGTEIFAERPFDEVSIDDIAAAAQISKGLLYHYFPSKRDFYVEVVRCSALEMEALTEPDPSLEPRARRSASLDRYLDYVETHAQGYSTLMRAGIGSDPQVGAVVEEVRARIVDRIVGGMTYTGDEPPAALEIAVRGWVGFAEAASLDWLEHRGLPRDGLRAILVSILGASVDAAAAVDPRVQTE
ncbi:MAG: Transcriptional regulator, TetR family protein [Solirubrobacterales bacterium]|nr:Transcriptional regulator, TetR family protein [Solirubrobacterales bacterium]